MPAEAREIRPSDIAPIETFGRERAERRAALLPAKRLRRLALGPHCTILFESFDTLLFQVQEMLLIEKGGEEQLADEIAAYSPLVPKGGELVATILFEIDDPERRARFLAELGGVEAHFFLELDGERADGVPEGDVERSRADGKTSAVHFVRFRLSEKQQAAMREPGSEVIVGCGDPRYPHRAVLSEAAREELARDL